MSRLWIFHNYYRSEIVAPEPHNEGTNSSSF